jgi:lipopolysaccharide heptosyltransferase II
VASSERHACWADAERVLCVRLDSIGDVLMTTPAIRALRESRPGRHVTLLTSSAGAAIARLVPEVDDVIVHAAPWMKATASRETGAADRALVERIAAARFDAAVIFTVYSQSPLPAALLCHLADVPLRLAHCRENPYQLLTDWVPEPEPERLVRHEVRRQLDLVATAGCRTADERLSLAVPARPRARMRRVLRALGVHEAAPWAVVHPGATASSRRYPPDAFAAAARRLVRDVGCTLLFTGSDGERELVAGIQRTMGVPSHSLAGALDVAELAALIALAPVLIANNTGPVHLAAAVGTPVVDLYALTNPQHTPWKVPNRVLFADVPCKYCYKSVCPQGHHACLRDVPPEAVVAAAAELLREGTAYAWPAAATTGSANSAG